MCFVGCAVGSWVANVNHAQNQVDGDWTSPSSVREGLLSLWSAFILALIVWFAAGWIALGLALPLAIAHDPNLSPRTNFGSSIGKFFDRLHVATAFRAVRWTHHVRLLALERLGPNGRKVGRLDPILDIVNIATAVVAFIVALYVSSRTAT